MTQKYSFSSITDLSAVNERFQCYLGKQISHQSKKVFYWDTSYQRNNLVKIKCKNFPLFFHLSVTSPPALSLYPLHNLENVKGVGWLKRGAINSCELWVLIRIDLKIIVVSQMPTQGQGLGEVGHPLLIEGISILFLIQISWRTEVLNSQLYVSIGLASFRIILSSSWYFEPFSTDFFFFKMAVLSILTPALMCFITVPSYPLFYSSKKDI